MDAVFIECLVHCYAMKIHEYLDIDDSEIDSYILSKEEVDVKTRFWMKFNGEYMEEMERRYFYTLFA